MTDFVPASADVRLKKTDPGAAIIFALAGNASRAALLAFRKGIRIVRADSPLVADSFQKRFGPVMEIIALARTIEREPGRIRLPERYASCRRRDQRRLVSAVAEHLILLGAKRRRATLQEIGESFGSLVLEGTLQQRFCCKLATALGAAPAASPDLIELVALPMIKALRVVLRVGAARTRDAAIEGAGALLKLAGNPVGRFEPHVLTEDGLGDPKVNRLYIDRLNRRREMVLAVADQTSRDDYLAKIAEPLEDILKKLRVQEGRVRAAVMPEKERAATLDQVHADIETALYDRADRLRILPAVLRQNAGAMGLEPLVDLLRRSTNRLQPESSDPPKVQIAYAGYQESVFRTIDVALRRRSVDWENFDEAIAKVVKRIPRTITGPPAVANARIRATVATIRTAMTIVQHSKQQSKTKDALFPFVNKLTTAKPWLNLGIAEGCYRSLPELLGNPNHSNLYKPVLNALFKDLRAELSLDDLVLANRHLSALSCFRRILVSFADSSEELQLQGSTGDAPEKLDRRLRSLLRTPDLATLQEILRGQMPAADLDDIAEPVVAGVAYECDLLRATRPAFQSWDGRPTVEKVLLTRILALQMHAVSRDALELARYPFLHGVFTGMTAVMMPETEPLKAVWDILASLPAEAAEAADPDIQRFVEYRGRRRRATHDPGDHADDLPGYVLAMISPSVSEKIADGIAREIDLNLRHDRRHYGVPDFARPLYQVLLQGPHEAIFNHLLPRLKEPDDRRIAMLFRDHLAKVRASEIPENSGRYDIQLLAAHATSMADALSDDLSNRLRSLRDTLRRFSSLKDEEEIWANIDKVIVLRLLMELNALTQTGKTRYDERHRKRMEPLLQILVKLQDDVESYMSLPLGSSEKRLAPLAEAARVAVLQVETELERFGEQRNTLHSLREALQLFSGLVSEEDGEVWTNIENGNVLRFFKELDALNAMTQTGTTRDAEGHRKPIEPLLHNTLVDLQHHVEHYMSLPVGNFDGRSALLHKAARTAEQIETELGRISDLQPPEKAMLIALAQHLRDLFERTDRWFCTGARRLKESQRKDAFWLLATHSTNRVNLSVRRLRSGVTERSLRGAYREREARIQIEAAKKVDGPIPPRFLGQAVAFEKFAVDWMSSELDADAVEDVLGDRWSRMYAVLFETITSLWKVALIIIVPCLATIAMHAADLHWIEGAGFCVLAVAVIVAVLVGCTQFIEKLISNPENQAYGYWTESVFPRLGRLIVVPMALMVEFDHSYEFPAITSVWAFSLLLMIAFLATHFAIGRLIKKVRVPSDKKKKPVPLQPGEQRQLDRANRLKANRIIAVVLSYSFAAAVLFSIIFASSHHTGTETNVEDAHAALTHKGDHPDIFSLPRRAFLDFPVAATSIGIEPGHWIEEHGRFTFYPILLLSWTAYGLFFGLVLEGLLKGESDLGHREEETPE